MHRFKIHPKKILFLFVLTSTLLYNGIILLDKINQNPFPFGKSFFLQTENGRIRLEHKNQNTYCLNNKCGTLLNIKDTGFDFVFNDQISTLFFKTDQKEHFKKSSPTSAFPLKNKKNLFSFKYKTNQDTLTINVTQEGLCYHNNTKMPFIFVAGGKSIPSNTALKKTFLISEMDGLIFKNNTGEFFTLNIQKDNVYQIVTPPRKSKERG